MFLSDGYVSKFGQGVHVSRPVGPSAIMSNSFEFVRIIVNILVQKLSVYLKLNEKSEF